MKIMSQTIAACACFHLEDADARQKLDDVLLAKALEIGRAGGSSGYSVSPDEENPKGAVVGTLRRRTATRVTDDDHIAAQAAAEEDRVALVTSLIAKGARIVSNDRSDIRKRGKKNRGA